MNARSSFVRCALVATAIAGIAETASAKLPTAADPETAEVLYAKLDYEGANAAATRVLAQHGLTHDALVRATRVFALTHAALNHEEAARDAFLLLLAYEPDFQIDPNVGPKLSASFYEARGFWRAQPGKPGLETSVVMHGSEGATIRVALRDPTHVAKRIIVAHRWGADGQLIARAVAANDEASVEVESPPKGVSRLDYFTQAIDDRDDVVFESGTATSPKTAMLDVNALGARSGDGGANRSFVGSTAFWIGVGVIVIGGATAAVLLAHSSAAPTSATLTPSLQCGVGTKCN